MAKISKHDFVQSHGEEKLAGKKAIIKMSLQQDELDPANPTLRIRQLRKGCPPQTSVTAHRAHPAASPARTLQGQNSTGLTPPALQGRPSGCPADLTPSTRHPLMIDFQFLFWVLGQVGDGRARIQDFNCFDFDFRSASACCCVTQNPATFFFETGTLWKCSRSPHLILNV